jgi:hypothetical protein
MLAARIKSNQPGLLYCTSKQNYHQDFSISVAMACPEVGHDGAFPVGKDGEAGRG